MSIEGHRCFAFIDSGNTLENAFSENFARKVLKIKKFAPYSRGTAGTAKSNSQLKILGRVPKEVKLSLTSDKGERVTLKTRPVIIRDLSMDFNISGTFLAEKSIDQIHSQGQISLGIHRFSLLEKPGDARPVDPTAYIPVMSDQGFPLYTGKTALTVEPLQGRIVPLELRLKSGEKLRPGPAEFEFAETFTQKHKLNQNLSDRSVIEFDNTQQLVELKTDGTVEVYLINSTTNPIHIGAQTKVGLLFPAITRLSVVSAIEKASQGQEKELWYTNTAYQTLTSADRKRRNEFLIKTFGLKDNPHLKGNAELLRSVLEMLNKNWTVISREDNPGCTNLIEHPIYTPKGAAPVKIKNRPINPALVAKLKEQINEWLRD